MCLSACVFVCVCVCVHTPFAFSQFSRTSLIQQEWKSFLHGVHRRQKEMERKTRGRVGVVGGVGGGHSEDSNFFIFLS